MLYRSTCTYLDFSPYKVACVSHQGSEPRGDSSGVRYLTQYEYSIYDVFGHFDSLWCFQQTHQIDQAFNCMNT